MKVDKNTIALTILFSVCTFSGIYLDFFLSHTAYQINSTYFIKYEANREIVRYFVNGDFPLMFLFTLISVPIALFLLSYFLQKYKKSKYRKEYLICLVMLVYCVSMTRIYAGLTWYMSDRFLLELFQNSAIVLSGVIACFWYVMCMEKKNENKNIIKNNTS